MKKLLFIILFHFCSYIHACTSISLSQFNSILSNHSKPVTLIFFSTWCADCKLELEKVKNTSNFILVAEFDSLDKVNKNLTALHINTECYFDGAGEIRKKYGVNVVPTLVKEL